MLIVDIPFKFAHLQSHSALSLDRQVDVDPKNFGVLTPKLSDHMCN